MPKLIPREFIHQLLDRVDIVDLIDTRVPLKKKSGNNFFACCPFHTEKSPSFSVSQKKQFYYCFGCGARGNAIDFLMQYDRLEFTESIELLAKQLGLEIPVENKTPANTNKQTSLYELLEKASRFYQNQIKKQAAIISYLKKRGLTGEIAKEFELGYAPPNWDNILQHLGTSERNKQQLLEAGLLIKKDNNHFYDRFRDRIMFPIRDRRGRFIGFGGRIIEQGEPKYLNSPETALFQKGHELYGLHQCLKHNRKLVRIVIVEGYMDVIALFQYGLPIAVATMGTATTTHHLNRLFRYTSELIFCFDGDAAGRNAALRAMHTCLSVMKDGFQIRFLFLPEGEDPDSFIRKKDKPQFESMLSSALPISDFFFETLAKEADLNSTDGRARFVKLATEPLQQLPDSIFKQMLLEELARKTRMPASTFVSPSKTSHLKKEISKAKPPSALRLAVGLLIQHPELIEELSTPLPPLKIQGYDFLIKIVDFLKQNKRLTTGALLERWRDHADYSLIAKLAELNHMIPEEGIKQEFLGAIHQLHKLANQQSIDKILNKASQFGLTLEEKLQLQELIHDK